MTRRLTLLSASLLLLSASFASAPPAMADTIIVHHNTATRLSESNVRNFREDVEAIATGKQSMSPDEMTAYFQDHVNDNAVFSNSLHVELPGQPAKDSAQTLNKTQYIQSVVGSVGTTKDYVGTIDIKSIDIASDGKTATLKTTTKEHGKLTPPSTDGQTPPLIPVASEITCNETLSLSSTGNIQMQNAVCQSSMKVDPWNGQPLTAPVQ
jgi:hypothetical protein